MKKQNSSIERLSGQLQNNKYHDVVVDYFTADPTFAEGLYLAIVVMKKAIRGKKKKAFNIRKSTRTGATTNTIIAALILGYSIAVVETTNMIGRNTVYKAHDIFVEITGDTSKIIRKIPNNRDGCSIVREKIINNPHLDDLDYVLGGGCEKCGKDIFEAGKTTLPNSTINRCLTKTMLIERTGDIKYPDTEVIPLNQPVRTTITPKVECKTYTPDVLIITYAKLLTLQLANEYSMKNNFFTNILNNVDVVLFDEYGEFLANGDSIIEIKSTKYLERSISKLPPMSKENFKKAIKEVMKGGDNTNLSKCSVTAITALERTNSLIAKIVELKNTDDVEENTPADIKTARKIIDLVNEIHKNYIMPFFDQANEHINNETYPIFVKNCLATETIFIEKVDKEGNIDKIEMLKIDALKLKGLILHECVDDMLDNVEVRNEINFLLRLINIMQSEVVVYSYSQPMANYEVKGEYKYVKTVRESINISAKTPMALQQLGSWMSPSQATLLTDATEHTADFSKITNKKVEDYFYGDPHHTNDQLLIVHVNDLPDVGEFAWQDSDTRERILLKLEEIITIYPEVVVWCMNKNRAEKINSALFVRGNVKSTLYEPKPGHAFITYYRSVYARGVESSRRLQVLLDIPHVPAGSSEYIVLQNLPNYNIMSSSEVKKSAIACSTNVQSMKNDVIDFNGSDAGSLPDHLRPYLLKTTALLEKSQTYEAAWQAASRVKCPAGKERSILLMTGCKPEDVNNTLLFGSYVKFEHDNGLIVKKTTSNSMLVPAPSVVSRSQAELAETIKSWMSGESIENESIGFKKNFLGALYLMSLRGGANSESVWLNYAREFKIGHYSESFKNPFFIAMLNFYEDTDCGVLFTETRQNEYQFNINGDFKNVVLEQDKQDILDLLEVVYRMKKDRVTFRDISINVKKLVNRNKIREAFINLTENYPHFLFAGGWTTELNPKTNLKILVKSQKNNNKMISGKIPLPRLIT